MLASTTKSPRFGEDWCMEAKWDGMRCIASVQYGKTTMVSRTGNLLDQLPYLRTDIANWVPEDTILDGEIVACWQEGGLVRQDWGIVQSRMGGKKSHKALPKGAPKDLKLTYVVFDVLRIKGRDVDGLPLSERRKFLNWLAKKRMPASVMVTPQSPASDDLYDRLLAAGFEGAMVKNLGSSYKIGLRSRNWLKLKPQEDLEVECIDFYEPTPGSKYDGVAVGGMVFKTSWGYKGRCAGMDDGTRKRMHTHPEEFIGRVATIRHHGKQPSGALRHPQFGRWDEDE